VSLVSENIKIPKAPKGLQQAQLLSPGMMTHGIPWPIAPLRRRRQILRIKTGAAALESPSFEQLEAQKLALSEHEAGWARMGTDGAEGVKRFLLGAMEMVFEE
jgi:hypothetical protein